MHIYTRSEILKYHDSRTYIYHGCENHHDYHVMPIFSTYPLVMQHVVTHLSKEKFATKAEFFIVLHNHDCKEVTLPSRL